MHHSIIYASQYNIIHLSNARWERAERTYIPHINPQRRAHSLQHIHADWFVARHFPIGALTDPGQVDDVAGSVSASLEEEPEPGISDHVYHLFVIQLPGGWG